ncbi:hypothetical protein ATCV1_z690L [Acanthocystis turfacea chlorella virus 1]|uniref:Uncharacterized protein z690L n=1 Tax=Chlorovirus heliozoae TaxID=322019 RepID=A7K9V0_9PHYC|nr:hypothetical protein ATCV1_z690L [Acanthocystis turfacea chlorella virus 1]ABT16824.1 hypothetical protein ATCV1_z690L [Acanthocystis turfacea chlorella virus 1]
MNMCSPAEHDHERCAAYRLIPMLRISWISFIQLNSGFFFSTTTTLVSLVLATAMGVSSAKFSVGLDSS